MFGAKKVEDQPKLAIKDIGQLERELSDYTNRKTFTTDQTPHEVYLLKQSGYEPVGFVVGVIVYSMGLRGIIRSIMRAFTRGEMSDFSHLNEVAREIAIERMQKKADAQNADGVLGVSLITREYADFIEVVATGTAVRKVGEASAKEVVVGT